MLADLELPQLVDIQGETLEQHFHPGQWEAWDSTRRFIFMLAGTQGGKTSFGPLWLHREIFDEDIGCGPGDYLAVTASYDLFKLKMLPALREYFEHTLSVGRYWAGDKIIELRDPDTGLFLAKRQDDRMWGRIILRSARSDGGLESATGKAAWLDECGQEDFTITTWQAVRRRLSLHRGRVLGTTTLYVLYNWLRSLYNDWQKGDPDIDFVQFASILNPLFPKDEYDDAMLKTDDHVFSMFYRGEYDTPPGMIYKAYNDQLCTIKPFSIPEDWPSYCGLDFGGTNTAAIRYRHDQTHDEYFVTNEYLEGDKESREHAADLRHWGNNWTGGSWGERQWRKEFGVGGLPVQEPPFSSVWTGINKVIALHKQNKIKVFDTCTGYLSQKGRYSRPIDKSTGEPKANEIKNKKDYHFMDAERYLVSRLADSWWAW